MKKLMKRKSFFHTLKTGLKLAVLAEAAFMIGSYFMWRKMNSDIDFRHKVYQRAPYILEYYYKVGEKLGGHNVRETDYMTWGVEQ